jgi:hypothetical protein
MSGLVGWAMSPVDEPARGVSVCVVLNTRQTAWKLQ